MLDFFKRNIPVLIVGIIVSIIFLIVIIVSLRNDDGENAPSLINLNPDSESRIFDSGRTDIAEEKGILQINPDITDNTTADDQQYERTEQRLMALREEIKLTTEDIDSIYGAVEITIANEGFEPRATDAYVGQVIRWINTTNQPVVLTQVKQIQDDWKDSDKTIPAGETLEYRPQYKGIWTYKDIDGNRRGVINITTAKK